MVVGSGSHTHARARNSWIQCTAQSIFFTTARARRWNEKKKKYKLKIKCYLLHCWRECRMLWLFINQSGAHILSTQGRTIKKSDFPPPFVLHVSFTPQRDVPIWQLEHNSAEEDAPVYDDDAVHIYRLDRRVYCLSRILIVLPYAWYARASAVVAHGLRQYRQLPMCMCYARICGVIQRDT